MSSSKRTKLQERYELREVLGRGGMGVVYRAYDRMMNRDVALKTILDIDNPDTLNLFYKEWSTLVTMVHPNVINIYDIGEFEQDGAIKPFFVMPLLPGVTLDRLIKDGSPRLSVSGVVAIIEQAARGLHAAHEQGLVHRDVKPSNIFVMEDGSVKIIDFGIAQTGTPHSNTTVKGTLYYLAPEQLELKPPSPLSDLFALAVVTYEALTRRRPFQAASESDVIEAIKHHSPPPISEVNHEVIYPISQVVHKAMAKQPWHRFFNIREYGEALVKAMRNEPLEYFDSAKIKPRLERASQSFEKGDYEFASEVLAELEAEGHLDQGVVLLRGQVDQAVRQIRTRQMLENARRYFEADEYPLALRKVQEALELDPTDATALSLKAEIEKQRREKKISEWITLARQHMENQAFRKAREALDNVLQIKPNETEALRLAAEVGRREQEVARAREEKTGLYQSAMHCWEQGDVTSALSKLEVLLALDRDLPESDSGRSGGYQSFYNKVQTEHNALKNAYEEARRNLAADNFEAALAISKPCLAKYPNHALFQALQFDIEERQRQSLSAVIAETDRRADEEFDLDRRLGILENALKLYPGEPHFVRAIQLVRDKRDLVSSIVSKAHFFEERNQFVEALDQWQILKSIHEKQPGLAFDIERLIKRRDQQGRQNAKARWVEQTDKYLEGGDYDRAAKTLQNAMNEFPGEPELLELDKLVRKNQERSKQAQEVLDRAREQSDKGATVEAIELLRQANELDPRNTVIRTVLVNTLFEQARRSIDSSPEAAGAAVQEILQLDPNHSASRSLASQLTDRKKEDFITWCLSQARRLQTDGDFDGALAVAAQGMETYPNEARLHQLKATLERAQREAQRQARPPRPTVSPTSDSPPSSETPPSIPEADVSASGQLVPPQRPSVPEETVMLSDTERRHVIAELMSARRPPEMAPAPPPKSEPGYVPKPAAPRSPPNKNLIYVGAAAASVVVLILLGMLYSRFHSRPVTPAMPVGAKIRVTLRSTPSGAEISVNGAPCGSSTCELELAPGEYRAEARLADYEPATANFTITADQSAATEIKLMLSPPAPLVAISTDLADGNVLVDQAEVAKIQGSAIEIQKLPTGQHTVLVQSGAFRSSFTVDIADGQMPKLAGMIKTQGMHAFVLVRSGLEARVYASEADAKVTLDGKMAGMIDANGLDLRDLPQGSHELLLDAPNAHARMTFTSGPANAIQASLISDQNLSVLNIITNEDDVQLFLDNSPYRRLAKRGSVRIYLPAKKYSVRVQKDGFPAPPEQVVDLHKGQESEITFQITPPKSTLAIHHGLAGAEVLVDGKHLGIVRADGEFSAAYIEVGKHAIQLRHDRYKPIQSDQVFVNGKTIDMDGTMQSLFGTLKIELNPQVADIHLRLRHPGEADRDIKETMLSLQEGTYTVLASAPKFQDAMVTVHVVPDGTAVAAISLRPVETAPVTKGGPTSPTGQAVAPFLLNDWLKEGWNREGAYITRQGGDFVLAPLPVTAGSIQFSVISIHGKRIEWVAGFRDIKNYYLFQVEDTSFNRIEIVEGKRSKTVKVPQEFKRDQYNTFAIEISPTGISHAVLRGTQWHTIDNWQSVGGLVPGKFGFHIPGRDQIALSDFRLTPK